MTKKFLIEFVRYGRRRFCSRIGGKHKKLAHEIDTLDVKLLLDGKYDGNNAIITIHSGSWRNRSVRLGRYALQNVQQMVCTKRIQSQSD